MHKKAVNGNPNELLDELDAILAFLEMFQSEYHESDDALTKKFWFFGTIMTDFFTLYCFDLLHRLTK